MAESRQDELYDALQLKGYPEDFCREIAYRQMNTDYTATRMLGYLYRISEPNMHRQRSIKYIGKGCRKEKQEYDE